MKFRAAAVILAGLVLLSGIAHGQEGVTLKTEKDKTSYAIGAQMGSDMRKQTLDVDPDMLARGLKDALSGAKLLLTDQQMSETLAAFQKVMVAKRTEMMKQIGANNKKDGEAFLTENGKKDGVKTLPSGLQYKILKEGAGSTPKPTDTVTVNYRGTLIDGTEFDSSYRRGEAATFPVRGVITGWTEALQIMKSGSKWQLFVPPMLAYGEQGAGPLIGPNATLIFEVELLAIK